MCIKIIRDVVSLWKQHPDIRGDKEMKKNLIKVFSFIAIAVIILVATIIFSKVEDGKISTGIYKVTGYDEYPEAYIEVKDSSIQFHNIDLNAIYQEEQINMYQNYVERYPEYTLGEKEVEQYSDLNHVMAEQAYEIDYERFEDAKSGSFEYTYFVYPGNNNIHFGLVILYDAFHKTIHINNEIQEITFEK